MHVAKCAQETCQLVCRVGTGHFQRPSPFCLVRSLGFCTPPRQVLLIPPWRRGLGVGGFHHPANRGHNVLLFIPGIRSVHSCACLGFIIHHTYMYVPHTSPDGSGGKGMPPELQLMGECLDTPILIYSQAGLLWNGAQELGWVP